MTTTAPANAEPKFPWLIPWTVSILYGIICLVLVVLQQEAIWWFSLFGVAVVAVLWIGAAIVHQRAKNNQEAAL